MDRRGGELMRATPLYFAIALALVTPVVAHAQDEDARVRIGVNGGVQLGGASVAQNFTLVKNVENGTVAVDIPPKTAPLFDVDAWVRLVGRVGVGVAFSSATRSDEAAITASVPHPFFYNQLRAINGTQSDIKGQERAVHIDLVVLAAATPQLELAVFGGATSFTVKQDLVTDIAYIEAYPYDTAEFRTAITTRASTSKLGYNAGADVTWSFSEHIGVGGLFRFSRASVTYDVASGDEASATLGGLQAGGGLRVRF
jgi:hypothetical protein